MVFSGPLLAGAAPGTTSPRAGRSRAVRVMTCGPGTRGGFCDHSVSNREGNLSAIRLVMYVQSTAIPRPTATALHMRIAPRGYVRTQKRSS
ncbi:hypothetical protein GCM10009680_30440 [Streptomyces yatensis]|uniref:Secreted protein n=1 Tax=Streptomyces yatensis TaxID=155177 RepID=A0ABN2HJ54_9ACTN